MSKVETPEIDILELGDGQLAYLTGLAAVKKGLKVGVVGESPSNSAGQIADRFFVGNINDGKSLEVFMGVKNRLTLTNPFSTLSFHR